MFIGDLVKLRSDMIRDNEEDKRFIRRALKDNWIWLITGIGDEDLDYIIQPVYLYPEVSNMTQLGAELLVLNDEIEKIEIDRKELFKRLNYLDE